MVARRNSNYAACFLGARKIMRKTKMTTRTHQRARLRPWAVAAAEEAEEEAGVAVPGDSLSVWGT